MGILSKELSGWCTDVDMSSLEGLFTDLRKRAIESKNFENIISEKILILDHFQDTNNLGAVVRSAAAFDFQTIFLPKKRSVQITDKTFAISSGGMELSLIHI